MPIEITYICFIYALPLAQWKKKMCKALLSELFQMKLHCCIQLQFNYNKYPDN